MKARLSIINTDPGAEYPVAEYIEAGLDSLADRRFLPELRDVVAHARRDNHTIRLDISFGDRGVFRPASPAIEEVALQLKDIVERAQADLGKNLGGGSMTDLCCDNTQYPIELIRVALTVAGLNWEVKNA